MFGVQLASGRNEGGTGLLYDDMGRGRGGWGVRARSQRRPAVLAVWTLGAYRGLVLSCQRLF